MNNEKIAITMARIDERTKNIEESLQRIRNDYMTKTEFRPYKETLDQIKSRMIGWMVTGIFAAATITMIIDRMVVS